MRYLKSSLIILTLLVLQFNALHAQSFTEQTGIALTGVFYSAVAWGDYDNDGDLDLLVSGSSTSEGAVSKIYRNEGGNVFAEQTGIVLTGVTDGEAAWGDYDNDGDLDIMITGNYSDDTQIYRNNGGNSFSAISGLNLADVFSCSSKWGDYDNDGDLDILMAGRSHEEGMLARVYQNRGNDSFVEQEGIALDGVERCGVDWGDYNNDGLLDILLSGTTSVYPGYDAVTKIYKNNGDNTFTDQIDFNLTGTNWGRCVWGDYDNDGDLDFIQTGYPDVGGASTRIYRNDGGLAFTYQSQYSLMGMSNSDVEWGDYDNDGDLDILMAGAGHTALYRNDGDDFVLVSDSDLPGIFNAAVAWGDYDNDGDLDFVLAGDTGGERITRIFRNNSAVKNTVPGTPSGLQFTVLGNSVTLSWTHSSDVETPQAALSYALEIGRSIGGVDVVSPMADLSTGYRRITGPGHIQDNTWILRDLEAGTHYWRVQAIDQAFAGSAFSYTGAFAIGFDNWVSPVDDQTLLPKVAGNTLSVAESQGPGSRQWKYSHSPGGPYDFTISGATGSTYTPNFAIPEIYYVVCVSERSGVQVTSNEVKITVPQFSEVTGNSFEINRTGSLEWGDYDNDGDLDLLMGLSGVYLTAKIYRNNGDHTFDYQSISLQGVDQEQALWGDYNRDGHLDILLSGSETTISDAESSIFMNNGNNTFSEQTGISLTGTDDCSLAWVDTDNDGDLDIINAGITAANQQVCILYRYDGNNQYTELQPNIIPFSEGGMDMGDYDNDGYPDLALVGTDYSGNEVSRIYRNNGDNTFSEQSDIDTRALEKGSAAWGDYDNDGDVDLLLAGKDNLAGEDVTLVYRNDGNNSFTELTDLELSGVQRCAISWVDYDNDGDLDICILGDSYIYGFHFSIYRNEGSDNFTEQTHIRLPGVYDAAIAWGDYDNDRDLDMFITGTQYSGVRIAKLYRNNSLNDNALPATPGTLSSSAFAGGATLSWNRASDSQTPSTGLGYNISISSHIDSSNVKSPHSDFISGHRKIAQPGNTWHNPFYTVSGLDIGTYYWKVQTVDHGLDASGFSALESFTVLPPYSEFDVGMTGVDYPEAVAGDYDADGDMDIIISGETDYGVGIANIYRNDGSGVFVDISAGLADLGYGSADWCDYDQDGDMDLLLSGSDNHAWDGATTSVYRNNGSDSFSEQSGIDLLGLYRSDVKWGDLDNDGLSDIVISGDRAPYDTRIYRNNGDNTFTEQLSTGLERYSECSVDLADYDNDMDLDIVISGLVYSGGRVSMTTVYRNDGDFNFTDIGADLIGVYLSAVGWGDYDNDGDQDFIVSGIEYYGDRYTKIYRNDGDDTFVDIDAFIRGLSYASIEWGDCDNDGDLDLLFSGVSGNNVCEIYRNDGADVFTEVDYGFLDDVAGEVSWMDYDNDRDLDIVFAGKTPSNERISRIFRNNGNWSNARPAAPTSLAAASLAYGVILNWNAASDDQTPAQSLSYNIRVGSSSGTYDIIAPMSDLSSGHRYVHAMGNCDLNTGWYIDSLAVGTYYWSVQAIDQTFLGGDWSSEQSFTITSVNADFEADAVCEGLSTSFTDLSITSGDPFTGWSWDFGDGAQSTSQNPTHLYAASGTYAVRLIAQTSSYSDTVFHDVVVKPKPLLNFTVDVVCQGTLTPITNLTTTNGTTITSWDWDFGDGTTSGEQHPDDHPYLAGDYPIELQVMADNGCGDALTKTASVGAIPVVVITTNGDLEFCSGDSVILSNNTWNATYSYQWQTGGTDLGGADSSSYEARSEGVYTLEITNPVGDCSAVSDPKTITVNQPPSQPAITIGGLTEFCNGESVELSVADNADYTYTWMLNGGSVGTNSHTYMAEDPGEFTVRVEDSNGCYAFSLDQVAVTVIDTPMVSVIETSDFPSFCEGESITLSVTDNASWDFRWRKDGFLVPGALSESLLVDESGDYHIEAINADGCVAESNTQVVDVITNPVPPVISAQSDTEFCEGGSVVLSTPFNDQHIYTWRESGGDQYVSSNIYEVTQSGSYSLDIVTDGAAECSFATSDTIEVLVLDNPKDLVINADRIQMCEGESELASVEDISGLEYKWLRNGVALTGGSGTTYTVTTSGEYVVEVQNEDACITLSSPKSFTVDELPQKPVLSEEDGLLDICPGEELTLRVDNYNSAYPYHWFKDGDSLYITGSSYSGALDDAGYSVRAGNDECTSESDKLNITWKDALDKPLISAYGPNVWYLSCSNENANTYRWYHEENLVEEGEEHIYVANQKLGKYRVAISDDGTCFSSSDVISIPDNVIIGMEQNDIWENLKIYPNPTPGLFTLEMDNPLMGDLIIDIFNESGGQIINIKFLKETSHFKTEIDLSAQPPSLYLINLILEQNRISRTLIVE